MRILFSTLLLIIGLGESAIAAESSRHQLVNFSQYGFDPGFSGYSNPDSDSKAHLVKRFGVPVAIKTRIFPDGRDPTLDWEEAVWEYDGLIIAMITPLVDRYPLSHIEAITLSGAQYDLLYGLNIGSSKALYVKVLGEPTSEMGHISTYKARLLSADDDDSFAWQNLVIVFDDQGRSVSIKWE